MGEDRMARRFQKRSRDRGIVSCLRATKSESPFLLALPRDLSPLRVTDGDGNNPCSIFPPGPTRRTCPRACVNLPTQPPCKRRGDADRVICVRMLKMHRETMLPAASLHRSTLDGLCAVAVKVPGNYRRRARRRYY